MLATLTRPQNYYTRIIIWDAPSPFLHQSIIWPMDYLLHIFNSSMVYDYLAQVVNVVQGVAVTVRRGAVFDYLR